MADTTTPDKVQPATPAPPPATAEGIDPHAAAMSPEAEAHRKALADDWGQWVAKVAIPYGNVNAYLPGDPVPATNVRRWKYDEQGLVEKVGTKAGQKILEDTAAVTPATIVAPGD